MNLTTRLARSSSIAAFTALSFLAAELPRTAFGQVNVTQAESLFNQGKTLIEQKKYHEACDKFSASLKLDETTNTHLALARCLELDDRAASSWGEYLVVAKKSPDDATRKYAQDHAKELEKKMLKVHLTMGLVPDDLVLKIDNEGLPKESLNGDLPLDPGDHVIEASAAGKHKWEKHVKLASDNSPLNVTISLEDMSPAEIKAQQDNGKQVIVERGQNGEPRTEWSGAKTAGFVIGGVGVVSGLAAVTFGILTLVQDSNRSKKADACAAPTHTAQDCTDAQTYHDSAIAFQTTAIITGVAAGVLVGTGIVMILVGGNKKVSSSDATAANDTSFNFRFVPVVSQTNAGMGVVGSF